jgi:hypothetical protein
VIRANTSKRMVVLSFHVDYGGPARRLRNI